MWLFIDHEASTLHHDGVTAAKIAEHICTITTAFILMTLKILVFIENDLLKKREREDSPYACTVYRKTSVNILNIR